MTVWEISKSEINRSDTSIYDTLNNFIFMNTMYFHNTFAAITYKISMIRWL